VIAELEEDEVFRIATDEEPQYGGI